MRRAKRLFDDVLEFANLRRAYRGASAGLRRRAEVAAFEHDLEGELWRIRRALAAGEGYPWQDYRRFVIRDPKRREIRAAPFADRVVHHAIFNIVDPVVRRRLIDDTYACIPGRGTHGAVYRYRSFVRARDGQGYRLQCDVKSYFASVDHRVLLGLLERCIGDARLLALLRSLIEHGAAAPGRGMPIGNLTSQLFANLYLDPLDHFVKEELRARHYLRYMDDFVLLADDAAEAQRWRRAIDAFLAGRLVLRLNPRRTVLAPLAAAADVLGYVHFADGRVRVRRRSARAIWRRLPSLAAREASGSLLRANARATIASWQGHAAHADSFRLARAMFVARDVRGLGKRMLVRRLGRTSAAPRPLPAGSL
jgi:RNA-directed DNA polymerase